MLGLPALALTYVATHSVLLQLAVAFALLFVAQPLAARRFGQPVDPAAVRELAKLGPMYNPPPALLVEMYLPLGSVRDVRAPEASPRRRLLGLADLRARRRGGSARRRPPRPARGLPRLGAARPLRDITLAALALALALATWLGVGTYLSGSTASAALLAAGLGAGAMAAFGIVLVVFAKLKC